MSGAPQGKRKSKRSQKQKAAPYLFSFCTSLLAYAFCFFALMVMAGCGGPDAEIKTLKTEHFEPHRPEPLWYQETNRLISDGETSYGYGYGKTLDAARLVALTEIQRDVVPPRLFSTIRFRRARDVQDYDNFVQGRTHENLVRDISSYYRTLTISGAQYITGSYTQLGGYYYVGLSYDKRALHIKLEERLAGKCSAANSAPNRLEMLRHDVRIAQDLRRMGCPAEYRLDYDKGVWRLDVQGERLDVTDEDLHKYFFPPPTNIQTGLYNSKAFQVLTPSGQRRGAAFFKGDTYRIRYQPSTPLPPHLYWLYIDAIGRVYSLQQYVSAEGRDFVLPSFESPPFEAVLNQNGEDQAYENFLLLKCPQKVLQLRIPPVSEALPTLSNIHHFKLGLVLSNLTDACAWESLNVTISQYKH